MHKDCDCANFYKYQPSADGQFLAVMTQQFERALPLLCCGSAW